MTTLFYFDFIGDIERLTFFYVWVGALFVANILLLVHTAIMLYQTGVILRGRRTTVFEESGNRVSSQKNVEK